MTYSAEYWTIEKAHDQRKPHFHVIKRNDENSAKKTLYILDRPRGRGIPPATWWSNIQKEIQQENQPETEFRGAKVQRVPTPAKLCRGERRRSIY